MYSYITLQNYLFKKKDINADVCARRKKICIN